VSKLMLDLTERVATTFAFTFLSVFLLTDMATAHDAMLAACAACLSLLKGSIAQYYGDGSAGLLK
jgi:hypothetical protein